MKTLRENLLLQFSVVTFVILGIMIFFTARVMKESAANLVLEEATAESVSIVSHLLPGQLTPEDFQKPMSGDRYDVFNNFMQQYIVSNRVARIKLWSTGGQVIFSTDRSQVGQSFPIDEELRQALEGGIGREISIPQKVENEQERNLGTLIEVYAPIYKTNSKEVMGAYEVYLYFAPFAQFIAQHSRNLYTSMTVGGILLYLALFLIVRRGWHTILFQRREADTRLREVQGLNSLFRQNLVERDQTIESLRHLSTKIVPLENLNREELIVEYNSLKKEITHLAEEVSRPHLSE
ncbi:MAG: hypothetical protein HY528_04465 [Chloroflexi bacterium]|nr:hypothetical protein [Chloroflexota bacterium]